MVMRQLFDFSDERNKGACIHCEVHLLDVETTRDHVPSKALLNQPYPDNLPVVDICGGCNSGFSEDEEYLACFLASVVSDSTNPDPALFPVAAKALAHSPGLRERIGRARRTVSTRRGNPEIQWMPEMERVERVILKNARGHLLFEIGDFDPSDHRSVGIIPIQLMSDNQRAYFENAPKGVPWAEVGSRMMNRQATGDLQPGGWVEIQPSIYRYSVHQLPDRVLVRMVLREYLAAEVSWA